MKKLFILIICTQFAFVLNGQEKGLDSIATVKDTTKYLKTINYTSQRTFKGDLKEKYTEKDFIYVEVPENEKENSTAPNLGFLKAFVFFMKSIFPFLLGGFIVFVILKIMLGSETSFWNFKKGKKKVAEKLVYEDEDIHEVDLEALLQQAIAAQNYRLAIRYYYLSVLKLLANKKLIDYHKDKTNAAYKFELEKGSMRDEFSYLSYVYTYVWYGEFSINTTDFSKIQEKYKSFKKNTHK
ncbi:hypothetical protein [uncultured Polaribacter sp.]|uniref:hypothetical protein n=1 Tax=uncultured Polaribacter sp. TaxID=174711 RepID=UPI0026213729|nr:hypothetical protein [uncultured Polaribacter sp.]